MKDGKIRVGVIGVHPERGGAMTAHIPALPSLSGGKEIQTAFSTARRRRPSARPPQPPPRAPRLAAASVAQAGADSNAMSAA
jgi:hypothetical protein